MKQEKSTTESTQEEPKSPWRECPEVWKTQAAYFNWIRGQMRRAWLRHPVKIKFININRFKAPIGKKGPANPKGKMVWAAVCAQCDWTFPTSKLQVDHVHGAGSFTGWEDFEIWMRGLMHINVAGLQFMCKVCHDTKTYSERHEISYEQAVIEKEVIAFTKCPTSWQIVTLKALCLPHNNAKVRRESYRAHLLHGDTYE